MLELYLVRSTLTICLPNEFLIAYILANQADAYFYFYK